MKHLFCYCTLLAAFVVTAVAQRDKLPNLSSAAARPVYIDVYSQDQTVAAGVKSELVRQFSGIRRVEVRDSSDRADYYIQFFISSADDGAGPPRYSFMWIIGKQGNCSYPHDPALRSRIVPCNSLLDLSALSTGSRDFLKTKITELANTFRTDYAEPAVPKPLQAAIRDR